MRILTDVRPIFAPDASSVRVAALHATMKVEYHPAGKGGIDSVFVTLDRGDLQRLQAVVNRALTKMDNLGQLLKESDVPRWTSNYHDHGST